MCVYVICFYKTPNITAQITVKIEMSSCRNIVNDRILSSEETANPLTSCSYGTTWRKNSVIIGRFLRE